MSRTECGIAKGCRGKGCVPSALRTAVASRGEEIWESCGIQICGRCARDRNAQCLLSPLSLSACSRWG